MWRPQGELDRRNSMQSLRLGSASSTDSLDELLSEFEVVTRGSPTPAQPQALPPRISTFHLPALLSRGAYAGRPPRQATPPQQVISQPYQPARRSHRQQQPGGSMQAQPAGDYEQQLLVYQPEQPPSAAEQPPAALQVRPRQRTAAQAPAPPPADDTAAQELLSTPLHELRDTYSSRQAELSSPLQARPVPPSQSILRMAEPHVLGVMPSESDSGSHHSPRSSTSSPTSPALRVIERSRSQQEAEGWELHEHEHALPAIEELNTARQGQGEAGGFAAVLPALKQALHKGLGEAVPQSPAQPSLLRKRDFESELLDRLLNDTSPPPGHAPPAKPQQEQASFHKGAALRRSMGMQRILFITTVFAILALFLLLFTNGRLHAQRAMRSGIAVLHAVPVPVSLTDKLKGDARGSSDARHHHITVVQHTSLPTTVREAEAAALLGRAAEDAKQHEHRSTGGSNHSQNDSVQAAGARQFGRKRPSIGLKLLEINGIIFRHNQY